MSGIPIVASSMPHPTPPSLRGSIRPPLPRLRRGLYFGLVAGTTLIGVIMMLDIVRAAGINALEIIVLVLFGGAE